MNFPEMQLQINARNVAILFIGGCFIYLSYLLWGGGTVDSFPDVEISMQDLMSYAILAAESGGYAVAKVHEEKKLHAAKKGKTKEGADEFVTRADLISNQLIMETLNKMPGLRVSSQPTYSRPKC